jgi:hypothetical protein
MVKVIFMVKVMAKVMVMENIPMNKYQKVPLTRKSLS